MALAYPQILKKNNNNKIKNKNLKTFGHAQKIKCPFGPFPSNFLDPFLRMEHYLCLQREFKGSQILKFD
jgi:hypothetical protein